MKASCLIVKGFSLGIALLSACAVAESAPVAGECVVLLHGLARTEHSMTPLAKALAASGYQVANVGYPSRAFDVESLAALAVREGLTRCAEAKKVHFVTHSLGGILVRVAFKDTQPQNLGRVVMLGPPNQGSEVVDALGKFPGFEFVNGPAGMVLGTGPDDLPAKLGPVDFEVGIIAGTRSLNPFLSRYIPNPDDGKVSAESTKVDGMLDFLTLPVTHTFMMRDPAVIRAVAHFLAEGQFPKGDEAA